MKQSLVILCFTVLLSGCSSEPTLIAISGMVKLDNVPAGFARVRVYSTTDPTVSGFAMADATGKYSLGDASKKTGLPAGEYKVAFNQSVINGKPSSQSSGGKPEEKIAGEKEGIPEIYRSPATSTEKITISSSSTNFDFDLKK
jgi:hypothetical protein